MALPVPKPALVIRYAYLWHSRAIAGQVEGEKDRPCAVVLNQETKDGEIIVTVAPITHSPPIRKSDGVPLPPSTKKRLGLDDGPAWIIVSEVNRFVWPGPDLRPITRSNPDQWAYGFLPTKLFRHVQAAIYRRATDHGLSQVPRSE